MSGNLLKKIFVAGYDHKDSLKEPKKTIDHLYKKYRTEIIFTSFFGYVVFYLTRKNFAAAMPVMMNDLGLTATDFGIISTLFYIIYGSSKFLNGLIADKINPKAMFGPTLIIIGLLNIFLGGTSCLWLIILLYCLNAYFQGSGFPPIAKSLSVWYSKNERGTWWSIWNVSHNLGGALAPVITSFVIVTFGSWRMGFYVPGVISLIMGTIAIFTMNNSPASKGLPRVGDWRNDQEEIQQEKESPEGLSAVHIFWKYIILNPFVWFGCLGYLCVYVLRITIDDWTAIYYVKEMNWTLTEANSLPFWFEIGGLVGGFAAGIISDRLFAGNRWKINMIYLIFICVSIILLPIVRHAHHTLTVGLFLILGFSIYGPQMLYAVGLIEVTHKNAAGAVTGFYGLLTYFGAALSGLPIALIKTYYSWSGVYFCMVGIAIISIFTLLPLFLAKKISFNREDAAG